MVTVAKGNRHAQEAVPARAGEIARVNSLFIAIILYFNYVSYFFRTPPVTGRVRFSYCHAVNHVCNFLVFRELMDIRCNGIG